MKISKILVTSLMTAMVLSACVGVSQQHKQESVTPTAEQSALVVYRVQDNKPEAVTVTVNGEYLTSLQSGAYKEQILCTPNAVVNANYVGRDLTYNLKNNAKEAQVAKLTKQQVSYIKLDTSRAGKPFFVGVTEEQAKAELKGLKQQSNTISRVSSACVAN